MPTISTITPVNITEPEGSFIFSNRNSTSVAIQDEKEAYKRKTQNRMEVLEGIVGNTSWQTISSKCVFSGLAGMICAIILTSFYTLIPAYNINESIQLISFHLIFDGLSLK